MITGNEPAMPRMAQAIGSGQDYFEVPAATGLTIRQHFAAMAHSALLSTGLKWTPKEVAETSVVHADNLIKALNNEK